MAKADEVARAIKAGKSLEETSDILGNPMSTTMTYAWRAVGERNLAFSEIFFAIKKEFREKIEEAIKTEKTTTVSYIKMRLKKLGCIIDQNIIIAYLDLKDKIRGDLYTMISDIEIALHRFIKKELCQNFGKDWFEKGVPNKVKEECRKRQEEIRNMDKDEGIEYNSDPYSYTLLSHLRKIIQFNWGIFEKLLPNRLGSNIDEFKDTFIKLNRVRNNVMHPVNEAPLREEEYLFVKEIRDLL